MTNISVKICGIRDLDTAISAARAGADYLGFVFFRQSPRFLSADVAEDIIVELKQASFDEGFQLPNLVGLFVDAGEMELAETAPFLTHFQFHGHEDAERCEEMGAQFGIEIIKAIPVTTPEDVAAASEYLEAADIVLFDAKPPPGAGRPGGHGISYDWTALQSYRGETPYFVAGGLNPENVAKAVKDQKAAQSFLGVDVSSGVESAPGAKDAALIKSFVDAARK